MEPLFRVNENGQLEEAVFQVADEAALQQELDQLQNELNQANEAHANASQVVADAQVQLDAAVASKEAAQTALTKSEARATAAAHARQLSAEQSQPEQVAGSDQGAGEPAEADSEDVGSEEQPVPVRLAADPAE